MDKVKINLHFDDLPNSVILHGDIAIDTETMGLSILRDRLCLMQICDEEGNVHLVQFKKNEDGKINYHAPNLKKYLLDIKVQKIFHYGRFDIAVLMHYLNIEKIPNVFCTKIASKLCRTYSDFHGLKTITQELLAVELKKEQQSSNWGAKELSNDQKKYATNDVLYLHKLRNKFITMLMENNRMYLAHNYFEFLHYICAADLVGFQGESIFSH